VNHQSPDLTTPVAMLRLGDLLDAVRQVVASTPTATLPKYLAARASGLGKIVHAREVRRLVAEGAKLPNGSPAAFIDSRKQFMLAESVVAELLAARSKESPAKLAQLKRRAAEDAQ
jgi:hypothetical protein